MLHVFDRPYVSMVQREGIYYDEYLAMGDKFRRTKDSHTDSLRIKWKGRVMSRAN
jgi:hypothetical protein